MLEKGRAITVYMHSYGDVYGPASLEDTTKKQREVKGLKGDVIAVIFTAAFTAPKAPPQ